MKTGNTCLLILIFILACISNNLVVIIESVFSQKKQNQKVIPAQQLIGMKSNTV